MSNHFRAPAPPSPAKTANEMVEMALHVRRMVEVYCQGHPADANTVLAMAYLSHSRAQGFGREHVIQTLDTLGESETWVAPS